MRFRERAELLDFLLEVSAAISETLDLDQLLANVAEIIQKVLPYDLFAILLYNEKRHDLRIRYASATATRWSATWRSPWAKGSPARPRIARSRSWWATCATIRAT